MTGMNLSKAMASRSFRLPTLNIWHLSALVLFTAVAIRNIQDQRMTEPVLIGLAALGFLGYGVLGSIGWSATRGVERSAGRTARLAVYFVAMGLLFLLATWIYLVLEYQFRNG